MLNKGTYAKPSKIIYIYISEKRGEFSLLVIWSGNKSIVQNIINMINFVFTNTR